MDTLKIHLFGKFSVENGAQSLPALDSRKVQELFSYLLVHCDQPHSREQLATLLWGEVDTAQSRAYLRKILWKLQNALDPAIDGAANRILIVDHDWIQINPEAALWCDVVDFQSTFRSVTGVSGERLDRAAATAIREAVDLYQGDLLDGWYQEWCLFERERLQSTYLALLDKLMAYSEVRQEYELGVDYGARILRFDRAREQAHRRLMRLYAFAGDRTASLRQFEVCATALSEELGVKPSLSTVALLQQIKSNELTPDVSSPAPADGKVEFPDLLTDVLRHLHNLHATVGDLQLRLQHDIQAVEKTLKNLQ